MSGYATQLMPLSIRSASVGDDLLTLRGSGSSRGQSSCSQNPAPLALTAATPDAMVDAVSQGIFETAILYDAALTDTFGHLNAHAV